MKELTIEQKAQRYDEAIERAKECHIDELYLHPSVKDVIEHIFPELAESEDERIRKLLIRLFSSNNPNEKFDNISTQDIIAWLEKQGEQKSAIYDSDVLEKHITKDSISELANSILIRNGWKVIEQKSAEWSEEDKVILNNIIWGVHMKSIKPLDEMDDRSKYKKYEDFLKSLPARFSLRPKAEWSEEDSMHLTNAIIAAEKVWGSESSTSKWLKSLKSQKEEQTEWDGTEIAPPIDSDVCG